MTPEFMVVFFYVDAFIFTWHVNAKTDLNSFFSIFCNLAGRVWLPVLVGHTAEPLTPHIQERCVFSLRFCSRYCTPPIFPSSLSFPRLCVVIISPLRQNPRSPWRACKNNTSSIQEPVFTISVWSGKSSLSPVSFAWLEAIVSSLSGPCLASSCLRYT